MMRAGLFLGVGFASGLVFFHLLRRNTRLFMSGDAARGLGLQLFRLASLTLVLVLAASHGAVPLLAAVLGIFLARPLILWREGASS